MPKFTLPMFLFLQVVLAVATAIATTNVPPRVTEVCDSAIVSDYQFCLTLLKPYASKIKDNDPNILGQVAISACLMKAQISKDFMAREAFHPDMSTSQRAVIKDCLDKVTDSIDSLRQAAREFEEMRQVKGNEQEYHKENVVGRIISSGDDQKACSGSLYGVHGIEIDGDDIIQSVQKLGKEAAEASLLAATLILAN